MPVRFRMGMNGQTIKFQRSRILNWQKRLIPPASYLVGSATGIVGGRFYFYNTTVYIVIYLNWKKGIMYYSLLIKRNSLYMVLAFLRKLQIVSLMIAIFILSLTLPSEVTKAQQTAECPLHSDIIVQFQNNFDETMSVNDELIIDLVLFNQNPYYMPGVRVVLGLFNNGDSSTPDYWYMSDENLMLAPSSEVKLSIDTKLSIIPAGDYVLKAIAFQGNEVALLGALWRDNQDLNKIHLNKNIDADLKVDLSVFVNNQLTNKERTVSVGSAPELRIETKNLNPTPLQNVKLLSMVGLGEVPLGGSILGMVSDQTPLLPQFARINEFSTQPYKMDMSGIILSTFVDGVNFTPIKSINLLVNNNEDLSFPYISSIGLSEYPLTANTEVVACVTYNGPWQELGYIPEVLQGSLVITSEGKEVFNNYIYSNDMLEANYFSFFPQIKLNDFELNFNLLQNRLNSKYAEELDGQTQNKTNDNFISTDQRIITVSCLGDNCNFDTLHSIDEENTNVVNQQLSLWFYLVSMAILMVIIYILYRVKSARPPHESIDEKLRHEELQ